MPRKGIVVVSIDRIDTAEAFASLAGAWGGAPAGDPGNVFLTHPWLTAWWRVYGPGRSLCALAASNGTGVAAVLPLVRERGPWGQRRLVLMGSGEVAPNHLDLVGAGGSPTPAGLVESFCDELWQSRREWDVLDLVSVADGSVLHRDLPDALRRRGCDVRVTPYTKCAVAELPASFDEFLGKLGQGTRGEFRRKRRKLLKDVPSARFARVEDEAELERVFREMVRLHQARWTRLGQSGSFASPRFDAFHRSASLEMLRRGWLRLYYLEAEGNVVAALYCFRAGRSVCYYAGGFDEAWKKHSVGVQTLAHAIEQSILEGAAAFDFLQGDEDYKSHWCTGWRDNWRVTVAAPHFRGRISGLAAAAGDRAVSLWRKHLPLETRRKIKGLLRRGGGGGGARIEDRG